MSFNSQKKSMVSIMFTLLKNVRHHITSFLFYGGLGIGIITGSANADVNPPESDRHAITDKISRYAYAWDSKNAKLVSELFTEDGILEFIRPFEEKPFWSAKSRQDIQSMANRDFTTGLADRQTRHH